MPSLGADMEAGTLVEWLCKPGDTVKRGDVVAVVETQKGAIEIEIFEDGVIEQLLVEPGRRVPVGTVLAVLAGREEPAGAGPSEAAAAERDEAGPSAAVTVDVSSPPARAEAEMRPVARPATARERETTGDRRIRISPAAASRAVALGFDPVRLSGTGPGGAITLFDVEKAAEAASGSLPPGEAIMPVGARPADTVASAMRRAIAAAMTRSKREIPHYYLGTSIDMGGALDWLERENLGRPVTDRLLIGALLLKAVARALRQVPELNGYWSDGTHRAGAGIHVGWAIALRGGGLVAPAIHDADTKSLDAVMAALRDLVKRARGGGLRSSELTDPTITVTSLGDQGVETVYGIIYPPQVALVGFGRIARVPRCLDGQIVDRPVVQATLAGDHRASDGHRGGVFLATIDRLLQEPAAL